MFPCGNSAWAVVTDVIHDGTKGDMRNVFCLGKASEMDKQLILAVIAAIARVFDIAIPEVLFRFKDIDGEAVLRCHPDGICPLAMWEAGGDSDCGAGAVSKLLVGDNAEVGGVNAARVTGYQATKSADFTAKVLFAFIGRGFIYAPVGKGQGCGHDAVRLPHPWMPFDAFPESRVTPRFPSNSLLLTSAIRGYPEK